MMMIGVFGHVNYKGNFALKVPSGQARRRVAPAVGQAPGPHISRLYCVLSGDRWTIVAFASLLDVISGTYLHESTDKLNHVTVRSPVLVYWLITV